MDCSRIDFEISTLCNDLTLPCIENNPKLFSAGISQDNGSIFSCVKHLHKNASYETISPFGNEFTISTKEMQIIAGIINHMDSRSTLALGLPSNQKFLKDEGKKIDHVHPLCFVWTILNQEDLKSKVKLFKDHSAFALKWNGFLGYSSFHDKGFGKNLEKYYSRKSFPEYEREFHQFYQSLRLKPEVMDPHAKCQNWRKFAEALFSEASYY